jgi:hypothetical protein
MAETASANSSTASDPLAQTGFRCWLASRERARMLTPALKGTARFAPAIDATNSTRSTKLLHLSSKCGKDVFGETPVASSRGQLPDGRVTVLYYLYRLAKLTKLRTGLIFGMEF